MKIRKASHNEVQDISSQVGVILTKYEVAPTHANLERMLRTAKTLREVSTEAQHVMAIGEFLRKNDCLETGVVLNEDKYINLSHLNRVAIRAHVKFVKASGVVFLIAIDPNLNLPQVRILGKKLRAELSALSKRLSHSKKSTLTAAPVAADKRTTMVCPLTMKPLTVETDGKRAFIVSPSMGTIASCEIKTV